MRRLLPILIAGTLLGALLPAIAAADATVNVPPNNVIFDPAAVTIPKGQSVNWNFSTANLDHNILFFAKDAPFPTTNPGPSGAAFTFTVGGTSSFQKTFTEAGLFRYVCTLHFASMRGTVTVTEPVPPPPPPPPGTQPLPPEPIAVASDRAAPFTAELFLLTGSEANAKRLTTTSGGEQFDPAWSYDAAHRQIAWTSVAGPSANILVADADGANPVDLTPDDASFNLEPSWSPDSSKIAFSSSRTGGGDIYLMDFDGSHVRQLTSGAASDRHPTWAPDGRRIAFSSDRNGVSRIFIMDVDPDGSGEGTNVHEMTSESLGAQTEPEWSPVADKIAYTQMRGTPPDPDPGVFDVATNTHLGFLTGSRDSDESPTWAPDGSRIIWSRLANGTRDLFIRAANGGGVDAAAVTLTSDAISYATPAWQPAPKAAKPRPVPPPPPGGGDASTPPATTPPGTTPPPAGGAPPPPADPGTAIRPSAFLALDVPHRTKVDAFRKLGLPVEARCTNLVKGTVRLTVSRKVARSLGLKGAKLASAAATCGADKRAAVLLKPGKTVKRALATTRARAAVRRARGLKATLTVFFEGGDSTLTDKLAITLAR